MVENCKYYHMITSALTKSLKLSEILLDIIYFLTICVTDYLFSSIFTEWIYQMILYNIFIPFHTLFLIDRILTATTKIIIIHHSMVIYKWSNLVDNKGYYSTEII